MCFGEGAGAALSLSAGELWWEERALLRVDELRLPGRHNVENAMAAAAVCLARGIDADAVRAGLRSFAGVKHRLEVLALRGGVRWVNDSKATNVASTLVALDAFGAGTVHLILGGQGKGQDFSALRAPVQRCCRAVYLIGEDAPVIATALSDEEVPVYECGDLERAVGRRARLPVREMWCCCRRPARALISSRISKRGESGFATSLRDRRLRGGDVEVCGDGVSRPARIPEGDKSQTCRSRQR